MTAMKHVEPIRDFLREAGTKGVHLEHGRKHPRLVYNWKGQERFYVVSATPGDRRATMNAISNLRHQLGLTGGSKRPVEPPADVVTAQPKAAPPRAPLTGWQEPPLLPLITVSSPKQFSAPLGEVAIQTAASRVILDEAARAAPKGVEHMPAPAASLSASVNGAQPRKRGGIPGATQKVPLAEVAPLLESAVKATNSSSREVLLTIGYTSAALFDWRKAAQAPLRAKYALLGLLSTLGVSAPQPAKVERVVERVEVPVEKLVEKLVEVPVEVQVSPFSFDETTALFGALTGFPAGPDMRRTLIGKLATEIARQPG